jgi:hypothetical protein
MKTNWLIPGILASLLVFAVAGCKPKETTLSGQVFIVTKGAENFKLGDVEVLLIEKSQVTNYLQKKQPAIESKLTLAQEELQKIKEGHVPIAPKIRNSALLCSTRCSSSTFLDAERDMNLSRASADLSKRFV